MKNIIKIGAIALSAITILGAASCGTKEPPVTEPTVTTEAPVTEPAAPTELVIGENGKSQYTIVYAANEEYGHDTAFYLHRYFREQLKISIDYVKDSERPAEKAEAFEIVVGKADRDASVSFRKKLKSGEFYIGVEGSSLYIVGRGEEETRAAVEYFIDYIAGTEQKTCKIPADLAFDSGEELSPVLEWEKSKIFLIGFILK